MNFFSFDLRKILLGLFLLAIPLVLLNIDKGAGESAWYKIPFSFAAGVIDSTYSELSEGVRGTTSLYLNHVGIKKDIAQLKGQNAALLTRLQNLDEMRLENDRLREVLKFSELSEMEMTPAQVIGKDLNPDHYTIVIDKGAEDGIKRLQAVIALQGVVGYVYEVHPKTSQVLLLTDRTAAIDALVQRSRARGIVKGRHRTSGRLIYLERSDQVKIGDLVVTSGLDGLFPKGFPIGRVTLVRKTDLGVGQEAHIAPFVQQSALEEVFVVRDAKGEDHGALFGPSPLSDFTGTPKKVIEPESPRP